LFGKRLVLLFSKKTLNSKLLQKYAFQINTVILNILFIK